MPDSKNVPIVKESLPACTEDRPLPPLTGKQKKFVEEYLIDYNRIKALRRAGYKSERPDKLAKELLDKPQIQAYLLEAEEEAKDRNNVTRDYFVLNLKDIIESDGRTSDRISALLLLARVTGHIKEASPENKNTVVVLNQKGLE